MSLSRSVSQGFTLVELIMVIVVLTIIATATSSYLGVGAKMYAEASDRDRLLSQSRFALERLTRELRSALPNSVRIHTSTTQKCVEFTPVLVATRYASLPLLSAQPDLQLFGLTEQWADLELYKSRYAAEGLRVYVYATDSTQIYQALEISPGVFFALDSDDPYGIEALSEGFDISLNFSSSAWFSRSSPSKRLYIVRQPVTFCVQSSGQLRRYSHYGFSSTTPAFSSGVLMAEGLNFNLSAFSVDEAVLNRSSVVHLNLTFSSSFGDELFFNQEVHVPNVP
ncbi:PilW family protein [Rheinheimera soli]|uniref:PilW family protein n=1 Tax=Rheinheimera soli TaxID=443616 RepID=UPI001E58E209|nr:prepilin-type N-terminal cleavage/methylation domain-containing protein [Rheinheimera soli]